MSSSSKMQAKDAAKKLSKELLDYLKKNDLIKNEDNIVPLAVTQKIAKSISKKISEYQDTLVKMRQIEGEELKKNFSEYLPEGHPELERAKTALSSKLGNADLSGHKYVGTYQAGAGRSHKFVDVAGQQHDVPEMAQQGLKFALDPQSGTFFGKVAHGTHGKYYIQRNKAGQQDLLFQPHGGSTGLGVLPDVPETGDIKHHFGSFNNVPEAIQVAHDHNTQMSTAQKSESMDKSLFGLPSKTHSEAELQQMSGVNPKQTIFSLMKAPTQKADFQGSLTDIKAHPQEDTTDVTQHKDLPKIIPQIPKKMIPKIPGKDVTFSRGQIALLPHDKLKNAMMGKAEEKAESDKNDQKAMGKTPGAVLPSDKMPVSQDAKKTGSGGQIKRGMKIPSKSKKLAKSEKTDKLPKSHGPGDSVYDKQTCSGCGKDLGFSTARHKDTKPIKNDNYCSDKCRNNGLKKDMESMEKAMPRLGGKDPSSKMMTNNAMSDAAKRAKNAQMPTTQQTNTVKMPSMEEHSNRAAAFGLFTSKGKWDKSELTKDMESMEKALSGSKCKKCHGKIEKNHLC